MMTTIELDYNQCEAITVAHLKRALDNIERIGGEDLVDAYDAITEALAHFMTKEELVEFSFRDVPSSWVDTILTHDMKKRQKELQRGMEMVQNLLPGVRGIGLVM